MIKKFKFFILKFNKKELHFSVYYEIIKNVTESINFLYVINMYSQREEHFVTLNGLFYNFITIEIYAN